MFIFYLAVAIALGIREYNDYGKLVPILAVNTDTKTWNVFLLFIQRLFTVVVLSEVQEFFQSFILSLIFLALLIYFGYATFMFMLHVGINIFGYIINKPKKPYK